VSSFAQRKKQSGWLEPSDSIEVSPGSLWTPDDEEERATRRAKAANRPGLLPSPDMTSELDWIDRQDGIKVSPSSLWASENLVQSQTHDRIPEEPEAPYASPELTSEDTQERILVQTGLEETEIPPTDPLSVPVTAYEEATPPEVSSTVKTDDPSEELEFEAEVAATSLGQHTTPRTLVLDESTVLPHEVSFATVPLREKTPSRPRVLDESSVLPGEASFATVRLYQKTPRSYSPPNRFAARFAGRTKQVLPVFLIIAVCAAAIIFRQKFKTASDPVQSTSEATVTANPAVVQTEAPVPQTQVEATANSTETVPLSSSPKDAATSPPVTDTPVQDTVAITTETPNQLVPRKESKTKVGPSEDARPAKNASSVTTKDVPIPKSGGVDSSVQTSKARTEPAPTARAEPVANSANDARKSEVETQPTSTGGGERPRRVSQQTDSQANSAGTGTTPKEKSPKPKVIQWP
jgi:hypothetical protein